MYRTALLFLLLVLSLHHVFAQEPPSIEAFLTAVEGKRAEIRTEPSVKKAEIRNRYHQLLVSAEATAKSNGDLEHLLALRNEMAAVTTADQELPDTRLLPPNIQTVRQGFEASMLEIDLQTDKVERAFLVKVIERLELWKKSATQQDRIDEAMVAAESATKYSSALARLDGSTPRSPPPPTKDPSRETNNSAPARPRLTALQQAQVRALRQKAELHLGFDKKATTAEDLSGNGRDATLAGDAKIVRGGKGIGALHLSGANSYAHLPAKPFDKVRPLTIALWFRGEGDRFGNRFSRILHKGDDSGDSRCFGITCSKGRSTLVGFHQQSNNGGNSPRGQVAAETSVQFENDVWAHLIMTFDGEQTIRMYVNGQESTAKSVPKTPWFTKGDANEFLIGRMPGESNGEGFTGQLDEILLWNKALSPEEISLIFASY